MSGPFSMGGGGGSLGDKIIVMHSGTVAVREAGKVEPKVIGG